MFNGDRKSQPKGPPFEWETRLASFPLNGGPEGWDFLEPLNTNDRFFFSYTCTNSKFSERMVGTCTVYLLVTSLRSMFTVNDARCTYQLEQRINSALNNEHMFISSKWIYKNKLISHSNSSK